jgi:hypothetical protein
LGTTNTNDSLLLRFEQFEGTEILQELMKHPNIDMYNRCNELMTKYFEPINSGGLGGGNNEMDMGDSYNNGGQHISMQS